MVKIHLAITKMKDKSQLIQQPRWFVHRVTFLWQNWKKSCIFASEEQNSNKKVTAMKKRLIKRTLRTIGIVFTSGIIQSFCIPKGGPDLEVFDNNHERIHKSKTSYEILVDFSKPSCEDRLFIYDVSNKGKLVYSGVVLHGLGGKSIQIGRASCRERVCQYV